MPRYAAMLYDDAARAARSYYASAICERAMRHDAAADTQRCR